MNTYTREEDILLTAINLADTNNDNEAVNELIIELETLRTKQNEIKEIKEDRLQRVQAVDRFAETVTETPERISEAFTSQFGETREKARTNFKTYLQNQGFSEEEIQTRLNQQYPEGVVGRTFQSSVDIPLRVVGEGIAPVVQEGISSALSVTATFIPDFAKENWDSFIKNVKSNETVQAGLKAAEKGMEAYKSWAVLNPEDSRTIESFLI